MAAKGVQRIRAGLTRHPDPRVIEVEALCGCCFATLRVPVDRKGSVRDQLREESCLFCGRLGMVVPAPRRSVAS